MNLLKILNNKNSKSDKSSIFQKIEHNWFSKDEILRETFQILESYVNNSEKVSYHFNNILFLKVNGSYACALDSNKQFILVFPELYQLLKSSKRMQGVAILMHELGHLVLDHQGKQTENERAQIEADLFANEMGLGKYLLEFLK